MVAMKLLIVEDECAIVDSLCNYLEDEQFRCDKAATFREAHEKIFSTDYDCIVLDLGLPGGSGLELLRDIRTKNKTDGVLVLTANSSLDDKLTGLSLGADDYLTKPFHMAELAARVIAIVRRKTFDGKTTITCKNLLIDLRKKTASVNDRPVDLTRKEYDLLLYFISNKNKVVTKNAIAEHLWGNNSDLAAGYDFIYTHIKNMRKKLIWAGCEDYVRSVYGMGYKFQQLD